MEAMSNQQLVELSGGEWDQKTACGALVGATVGLAVIGCPAAIVPAFWTLVVC